MRRILFPLAGLFLVAPVCRADDAADAKAIIDKAIKARGDKPDAKPLAQTWKEKVNFGDVAYAAEWTFQPPDKCRVVVTVNNPAQTVTIVVNGEKAWIDYGGGGEEVTGNQLAEVLPEMNRFWITTLTPLLTDADFTLATAKGEDVDKKPTVAVKVTNGKRPVATLYFDKETGLLVKREALVKEDGKEVSEETFFADYKEVGGRKFYTKMTALHDGKPWTSSTLSDHKMVEKLDAKLFEKP